MKPCCICCCIWSGIWLPHCCCWPGGLPFINYYKNQYWRLAGFQVASQNQPDYVIPYVCHCLTSDHILFSSYGHHPKFPNFHRHHRTFFLQFWMFWSNFRQIIFLPDKFEILCFCPTQNCKTKFSIISSVKQRTIPWQYS